MTKFKTFLFVFFILLSSPNLQSLYAQEQTDELKRDDATRPFVIAELFTSEGCSSCPPADQILSALTDKARSDNLRIFTLGFHVDYWNYLGWRDPFSNIIHTARQRQYGDAFNLRSIYTPQLVLNGKHELGGYKSANIQQHIDQLLTEKPQSILNFEVTKNGVTLTVNFTTEPKKSDTVINFAVVERNLKSDVRRGENAGRALKHTNVVRTFVSVPANNPEQFVEFSVSPEVNLSQATLIGYIQEKSSMKILGANFIDL